MASRKDELRAYQFLKQRAVSALVIHETDPEQPPFRRPMLSAFWGVALAVIALGIAGVVGLLTNDDKAPTIEAGKTVLVDNSTGTRFVSLDGELHEVVNYSSALLALGDHKDTQNVDHNQLLGLPRAGKAIGILGAPDQLPTRGELLHGQWQMCTTSRADSSGGRREDSALLVGIDASGGTKAVDQMVYVTSGGKQYVVWHGRRHAVVDRRSVTIGLGLDTDTPLPVAAAWLDIVPTGTAFEPIAVNGVGGPSTAFGSARPETRIGQIFERTTTSRHTYYLATSRDLVPLTATQKNIQLAATDTRKAYATGAPRLIGLDPGVFAVAKTRKARFADDLPAEPPIPLSTDPRTASTCAGFDPGNGTPTITVGPKIPDITESPTAGGERNGVPLADYIVVPPGRGALVSVLSNANADPSRTKGTLAFVSDSGVLFPLSSDKVVKMLGYDKETPVRISGALAARLPHGPALDPTAARKPIARPGS